jgi:hypothetical protein
LKLLDATWTKEERMKIIYKQHSSFLDVARLHRQVAKRVVFAVHILKQGDNVTRGQPSGQASDAVLGLGNTISKVKSINLDDYMPDWENNGSIVAHQPLMAIVEAKVASLQNPYNCR